MDPSRVCIVCEWVYTYNSHQNCICLISLSLSLSVPFHWFNFGFHTSNMWGYIRCNIESTRHCHSQLQYCIYRLFLKIRLHLFFIRFVIAFWQLKEERRTGEKKLFNCIYLCVCWHPIYLSLYGRRIGSIHFPYLCFSSSHLLYL